MGMTMIRVTMEKIIEIPILFLLVTMLCFLAVMAIIAAISYVVACARSKRTEMTGIIKVRVALNEWSDNTLVKDLDSLKLGEFWFSMKDPIHVTENRLDRTLTWYEKAFCRQYDVSLFLKRFLVAYEKAGFAEDASAKLLKALAENDRFCMELGKCRYLSRKKGLLVKDASVFTKGTEKEKVSVYHEIADNEFAAETGCDVRSIGITLEYRG